MGTRLAAMLATIVVLVMGCTDVQTPDASGDDARRQADAATSEPAPGPSESASAAVSEAPPSEAPPSEAAEESEAPDEASDDDDSASERPKKRRLSAAAPDDRGADVEALQRRLARLGFAPGPVDGVYGPQTTAAVEAFQMLAELRQTGRADARTVAALEDFQTDTEIVRAGERGRAVKRLQQRLADGPFDPGPDDGEYGGKTVQAVWALEKLAGVPVDGNWGPLDEQAFERLEDGAIGEPAKKHKKRWVEVDLSQQLVKVYDPGSTMPVLVSHASSGSGIPWSNEGHSGNSVTPLGDFVISRRIDGWRESSLDIGRLYKPLYFNGGIALHGALSVPLYPASHGCIRLPMHIADYLPDELPNGTPVHVLS
jgi:peptidoglycan hydrolase-like protein with peptidoglycan-binding domain